MVSFLKTKFSKQEKKYGTKAFENSRELVIRVLVTGVMSFWFIPLALIIINPPERGLRIPASLIAIIICGVLLLLIRKGHEKLVSVLFLLIVLFLGLSAIFIWSISNTFGILFLVLATFLAGILLDAWLLPFFYLFETFAVVLISHLQTKEIITVDMSWSSGPNVLEALVICGFIGVIVLVSWLSNREIEKSLVRSYKAERRSNRYSKELEKQKKVLEGRVRERTKKLEESQKRRFSEVKNFAIVGKIASGLLHDLANPITIATAKVDDLKKHQKKCKSKEVEDAVAGLSTAVGKIKTLLLNTRKQVLKQSESAKFNLAEEIQAVMDLVSYSAVKQGVKINIDLDESIYLDNDPVKFNQVVLNLVLNAIESYEGVRRAAKNKTVDVSLSKKGRKILLSVSDNGKGIPKRIRRKIFEDLYTTKKTGSNFGLGLSIVKNYVEVDYLGKIEVEGNVNKGTTFLIILPKNGS